MRLVLLLRWQALEHLHAIEHPLPLLRRQGIEALQPSAELDLPIRRKRTIVLVLLQPFLLLLGRESHGIAQPVAVMRTLSCVRRGTVGRAAGIWLRLRNPRQRPRRTGAKGRV